MSILTDVSSPQDWVQFFPENPEGVKVLDNTRELFELFEKAKKESFVDSGIESARSPSSDGSSSDSISNLMECFVRIERNADNKVIRAFYNKTYFDEVKASEPRDALYRTQAGLVSLSPKQDALSAQFESLSLDPVKASPDEKLRKKEIAKLERAVTSMNPKELMQDMEVLHEALAPSITIVQGIDGFHAIPSAISDEHFTHADTAIIMGSNDLWQVTSFYFDIYCKLPLETQKDLKIYISGFGGHGTTNGPIFGHTEAATMAKWLVDLGVPQENIIIESNATNSGQNIQFCDQLFDPENPPKKLIISGTPAADYRQVLTALGQSKYSKDFESLAMSPSPRWKTEYFDSVKSATIYTLCFLRELGSYVAYTLTSQFIAPVPLHNEAAFKEGLMTTLDYYNKLAHPISPLSKEEMEHLANDYIAFSQEKAALSNNGTRKLSDLQMNELKGRYKHLIDAFTPINAFFRDSFAHFDNDMTKLPRGLSFREHSQALRDAFASQDFAALNLDPPRKEGSFTNTLSLFESHQS